MITHPSMKILAIETATSACSVALHIAGECIHRLEIEPRAHTRILLPMINSVLKEAGVTLDQMDVLAYGCGPGSFTGVRIASAVIQGLGFGVGHSKSMRMGQQGHSKPIPIIPVSSLRALAQQLFQKTKNPNVCAMLDARMQEMYWGLFKANAEGLMEAVGKEQLTSKQNIILSEIAGDWLIEEGYPTAVEVAALASFDYLNGQAVEVRDALPVYLRNQVV